MSFRARARDPDLGRPASIRVHVRGPSACWARDDSWRGPASSFRLSFRAGTNNVSSRGVLRLSSRARARDPDLGRPTSIRVDVRGPSACWPRDDSWSRYWIIQPPARSSARTEHRPSKPRVGSSNLPGQATSLIASPKAGSSRTCSLAERARTRETAPVRRRTSCRAGQIRSDVEAGSEVRAERARWRSERGHARLCRSAGAHPAGQARSEGRFSWARSEFEPSGLNEQRERGRAPSPRAPPSSSGSGPCVRNRTEVRDRGPSGGCFSKIALVSDPNRLESRRCERGASSRR